MSYHEDDFGDFVQQVIDGDHLDDPAKGTAMKVVEEGIESLSEKQRFVFEKHVMNEYYRDTCETCSNSIPWSEVYDAYHNGGNCSYCDHQLSKLDRD